MEWLVMTADGRTLAVEDAGDTDGPPVLVHVGTPNSRHLYGRTVADAAARGLRLISYDRPGYGESTPQPGRTMADAAGDARAICAALGIDRLAGMGPSAAGEFALMHTDRAASRAEFEAEREEMLAVSPADLAERMGQPGEDRGFLDEAICMQQAYTPGIEGCWDDCFAQITPWGFDLAEISVPVLLMHGRRDNSVPFSHGEWLAAHIPGVEARLFDHDGHLTLFTNRIPEVHAWLADRL